MHVVGVRGGKSFQSKSHLELPLWRTLNVRHGPCDLREEPPGPAVLVDIAVPRRFHTHRNCHVGIRNADIKTEMEFPVLRRVTERLDDIRWHSLRIPAGATFGNDVQHAARFSDPETGHAPVHTDCRDLAGEVTARPCSRSPLSSRVYRSQHQDWRRRYWRTGKRPSRRLRPEWGTLRPPMPARGVPSPSRIFGQSMCSFSMTLLRPSGLASPQTPRRTKGRPRMRFTRSLSRGIISRQGPHHVAQNPRPQPCRGSH